MARCHRRQCSVPDRRHLEAVPASRPANMADDSSQAAAVECLYLLAWLSASVLVLMIIVALRRARLILGRVTVCGWVNHLDM